jgi:hypothetical protein
MKLFSRYRKALISMFLVLVCAISLSGCSTASQQEADTTWKNHQNINENIKVPLMTYSQRRAVLASFYKMMDIRYLPSCTLILEGPQLAYFDTIGPAVNLSNQMTSKDQSEPDSIQAGPSEQTMVVALSNKGVISEPKTISVTNAVCPTDLNLNFQQVMRETLGQKALVENDLIEAMKATQAVEDVKKLIPTSPVNPNLNRTPKK